MQNILQGKIWEYTIEGGGYKEGYSEENILPADVSTADNRLVLSIIVSKVKKEKFTVIESSQHSAWCMWKAL